MVFSLSLGLDPYLELRVKDHRGLPNLYQMNSHFFGVDKDTVCHINEIKQLRLKLVLVSICCTSDAMSSRLLRSFPKDLLQSLAEENITANFHFWSLSVQVTCPTTCSCQCCSLDPISNFSFSDPEFNRTTAETPD